MPANYLMTWDGANRRWRVMHNGDRYVISCRQLAKWSGSPVVPTKEGSYRVANAWWTEKRAEIDLQAPPHPHADRIAGLGRRRDWALRHGRDDLVADLDSQTQSLRDNPDKPSKPSYVETTGFPIDWSSFLDEPEIQELVWEDRFDHDAADLVPKDKSVGAQVARFLDTQHIRVQAGLLSPSEYDTIRRCVHSFRDWVGVDMSIERINADRWEAYWGELIRWDRSVEYKRKRLRIARSFIGWLVEKGLIPSPPNLHSRRLRFGGTSKAVPIMTVDEVRSLVANATGQLRLLILLMINCGMTQKDISDLRQSEVDWTEGRITRRRSKTRDNPHVPTVSYKLWSETWTLLQRYRQPAGDRVLLTKSGKPLVRDGLKGDGDRRSKVDTIRSNYRHLQVKLDIKTPLKLCRKTSASLLDDHDTYGRYTGHFLGHSPRSITDKHYVRPSPDQFDKAVAWLGQQYGFL
jgi:integrase